MNASSPHPASFRRHALAVAPALLAAVAVFYRAPHTFFASDDLVALARVAGLEPTPPTFRPLSAVVAFQLQYAAFGLDPLGYHLVNLALHLAAVVGVYALAREFSGRAWVAAAAALLFAASGIAFTPVHWVSGIGDLIACNLLLVATLIYREARRRDHGALLGASVTLAFAAVLAKESAIGWPLAIGWLEWRNRSATARGPVLWPAAVAALAMVVWLFATRHPVAAPSGPYSVSGAPGHLLENGLTYLRWAVAIWDPHRDRVAAVDPNAWPVGALVALLAIIAIRHGRNTTPRPFESGLAWFAAFVLPVLPLSHHTYLYYLYIPWAGGALAVAVAGAMVIDRWPVRSARVAAAAALVAVVGLEARGVELRQRSTLDGLPADRTLRESLLLGHVVPALRAAQLPPGTEVGFVNPVARLRFDLVREAPTLARDADDRRSYLPLEAVLQDGRALRLFTPGLVPRGFAATIPAEWTEVECFLYEQRGFLRAWGRGAGALTRQGMWQDSLGQPAAAESSFARARALKDTLAVAAGSRREPSL